MLKLWATLLVDKLIFLSKDSCDHEQREVYIYGLECILNTGITVSLLFLGSILAQSFCETFVWVIVFSFLRHQTGGYHAPSHILCIVSSTILGALTFGISSYASFIEPYVSTIYVILFLLYAVFTPVINQKKILDSREKVCHKLRALLILIVCSLVSAFSTCELSVAILYACCCNIILVLFTFVRLINISVCVKER